MSLERTYSEVRVRDGDRCLIVTERGDEELTAMAACMTALRGLDANAAARVAAYVADRHHFVAEAPVDDREGRSSANGGSDG